jgi:hypothetical protein
MTVFYVPAAISADLLAYYLRTKAMQKQALSSLIMINVTPDISGNYDFHAYRPQRRVCLQNIFSIVKIYNLMYFVKSASYTCQGIKGIDAFFSD